MKKRTKEEKSYSTHTLTELLLPLIPTAQLGEDLDGQIIVYTGLYQNKKGSDLTTLTNVPDPTWTDRL